MSHLHDLAKAMRVAADANDMAQVKRYLDQINNLADNLENQEKARAEAQGRSEEAAKESQGRKSIAGTGASQADEDKVQKAPETEDASTTHSRPARR